MGSDGARRRVLAKDGAEAFPGSRELCLQACGGMPRGRSAVAARGENTGVIEGWRESTDR
ncbi:hypothetical protein GCM10010361_50670 [Streptomyces olivaceiscleroticus]|uniref:Uncharacterized protein n=1 Tax=Streptomyces olivaceiscleroticus TaxID=68245 RepID=A0ABN1AM16_9ACTN